MFKAVSYLDNYLAQHNVVELGKCVTRCSAAWRQPYPPALRMPTPLHPVQALRDAHSAL